MSHPKLPPEAFAALSALFERALHVAVANSPIDRTCLACVHFTEATEICGKYNAKPCARVIVESCEAFERSAEPF